MKRSWFYVLFLILSFLIYVIWQNEKQMQLENLIGEKQEENERLNMKVFLLQTKLSKKCIDFHHSSEHNISSFGK